MRFDRIFKTNTFEMCLKAFVARMSIEIELIIYVSFKINLTSLLREFSNIASPLSQKPKRKGVELSKSTR